MTNCKKIKGAVLPIPIPFLENEEIDYQGLNTYIQFLSDKGIKNVMTTVGTSRFNLLSDEEVRQVNKVVADAMPNDGISIVANPLVGSTKSAISFAEHSQSIGADFFLLYFPERHYGEENTYQYFKTVAEAVDIPILIHEMPKRNGIGGGTVQYSLNLLERLLAIPNIVGFKEEALNAEYSNQIVTQFKDDAIIIGAGGGMSRYLKRDFERGSKAFLGGIGNFYPQLEIDFYNAITSGNEALANKIVSEIELPYFDIVVPYGWHPTLKAALAYQGLMNPFERRPMVKLSTDARKTIEKAVDNILNFQYA